MPDDVPPRRRPGARALLREFGRVDRRLGVLDRRIGVADFRMYMGRGDERASVRAQQERARFLVSPDVEELIRRLGARGAPARLARPGELLRRAVLDARVEQDPRVVRLRTRLQSRIVRYRPRWHGRRVGRAVVYDALRTSNDRDERKAAWLAEEPLRRSLELPLRGLILVRNELARQNGFRNYAELRLDLEGLSARKVRSLGRATLPALRHHVRRLRAEVEAQSRLEGWAPWDLRWAVHRRESLDDRLFPGRTMLPVVDRALRAWGFPKSTGRFRIARCDIPFGGLTIAVDAPKDVRVLVHPRGEWEYHMVLFHELGHAIHSASVRPRTHLERTLDPGFAAFSEGIATVFERVAEDPGWLSSLRGITPAAARSFAAARSSYAAIFAPAYLLGFETELALYERPDRDPGREAAERARQWYGYDEHPVMAWGDPFRVTHPVYVQSYLLAHLFQEQVVQAMRRATGGPLWPNRRAGPWLVRSFLAPGAKFDWLERLRAVTGASLSATPFVRSVLRTA